jgi:Putative metal-binding motif
MGRQIAAVSMFLVLLAVGATSALAVDFDVTLCEADVAEFQVRIRAEVYNRDNDLSTGVLKVFLDGPDSPPGPSSSDLANLNLPFGGASSGTPANIVEYGPWLDPITMPNGVYQLWCRADHPSDASPVNNIKGPFEYVVGPDLWPWAFWVTLEGDTTNYHAIVCNTGTDVAYNFRVGFYYDRAPTDTTYSDAFKSYEALAPAFRSWWNGWEYFDLSMCLDVLLKRMPTPNDTYHSWVKVDDGDFEEEVHEDNNIMGPYVFEMCNADLVIEHFQATVSPSAPWEVDYDVTVCNRGTCTAGVFWIDLYYDREGTEPPQVGEPGNQHFRWGSLPPEQCVNKTFTWNDPLTLLPTGPGKEYYESWVQVDADEFVYDPDRSTNLEGSLKVTVPGGVVVSGCSDQDGDGSGVGSDCLTTEDCNDNDAAIHPAAEEICDDGIDQNCNETPDDGCEGVDCQDLDGDGWPSGPDCVIPDCDDANPGRHPYAEEICGDGIDNDCDSIVDDCCDGVSCCDMDGDGYGVGGGCPGGVQDCDDTNPAAGSADAEEICNDNQDNDCDGLIDENCPGSYCVDEDDDGYGVGEGCTGIQDPDDNDPNVPSGGEICGDGLDNDANGIADDGCDTCVDTDNDGWYVGNGDDPLCQDQQRDCDDTNDAVNPGATEVCDLVDNDCDYTVDEGTPGNLCPDPDCVAACAGDTACEATCPELNCIDNDGDGWGSGSGCEVVDCDDTSGGGAINPGEQEICGDGIDQDCDFTPDDGCPGVDCVDHDGDGWGVGADCVVQDPDDNDPATWPGAPEICGDGVDQSADGVPDDGCILCTDHDGDGYGVGPFCTVRDCNDEDPNVHPGATEGCDTGDRNCDGRAPVNSRCAAACNCSGRGADPFGQWPASALVVLIVLGLTLRRSRRKPS